MDSVNAWVVWTESGPDSTLWKECLLNSNQPTSCLVAVKSKFWYKQNYSLDTRLKAFIKGASVFWGPLGDFSITGMLQRYIINQPTSSFKSKYTIHICHIWDTISTGDSWIARYIIVLRYNAWNHDLMWWHYKKCHCRWRHYDVIL